MPELLAPRPGLDSRLVEGFDWDEDGDALILANPEWVARQPEAAAEAAQLLPDLRGHVFVATSGTSRGPGAGLRWVALSRGALLASAAAVNRHLHAGPGDAWAHALPLFHVGGLGILARAHLSGAAVVESTGGTWDPGVFHRRVAASAATLSALVPTQVHDLVAAGLRAPASLRAVVVGGGRLDPALYLSARALGWPCLTSYGLTETASQIATAALESLQSAAYPAVLPLLDHAEARADDEGVLSVRGSSLLSCYVEIAEGETRTWDPRDDEGWFRTDDLGQVHQEGLEVSGRTADTVKVLGELVWLPRVEAAAGRWAAQEPLLAGLRVDLAVAAIPHARLGHELVLALAPSRPRQLDEGELLESLRRFEQPATLPCERIKRVALVEAIPRTALGKCRRAALASRLGNLAAPRDDS